MSPRSPVQALEGRRLFSGLPALSVSDVSFVEGNDGTGYASVVVSLIGRSNKTVSVGYGTVDNTATAGSDYDAVAGTLTFARGESSKVIRVPVQGDRTPESDESLFVELRGAKNASVARSRASLTVIDDEPRITASAPAGDREGDFGTTPFTFTVSLSLAYDQPVTVNFATRDNTAVAGDDYLAANGTLTFNPGETGRTITVMVVGDIVADAGKSFYLDLSGSSANAPLSGALSAYAQIDDEESIIVDVGSGGDYFYDPYFYWSSY